MILVRDVGDGMILRWGEDFGDVMILRCGDGMILRYGDGMILR